jgi:hypothetical protein
MFADPQTITVNGVAKTLNRVSTNGRQSVYKTDDELYTFTITHNDTGKGSAARTNRTAQLDVRTVAANPLTSVNEFKNATIKIIVNEPEFGFDDTTLNQNVQGLLAWATSSSGANVLKLLTDQS